ncbi:n-alkane-inducible cytochrome P450 [Microdochium bolleyi]|uniref:N-alkane-inducible cytochrome P450 n=1 Tax=Microdochium bolleyi TaxID=196109 RepID=A0A136JH67_9PEZI|nr:n-alkane-inducible cytochrome P450 [Microdochium bolleyi]
MLMSQAPAALFTGLLVWFIVHVVNLGLEWNKARIADNKMALEHGCHLPPELKKRWLLGTDRLKEIWNANSERRLLKFFCDVARDIEPLNNSYQFFLIGPRTFHILDPRQVVQITSAHQADYGFGARASVFAPLIGEGIFTQEGAAWKHSRELVRKQFYNTRYRNFDHFQEHLDNLISRIPENGAVDLQPLFFNLTLDTTTALLFGSSVYSLRGSANQDEENRRFARDFNLAQEGLAKRFRLTPFHALYNPRSFRAACRSVHDFVERYISDRSDYISEKKINDGATWFMDKVLQESSSKTAARDQLLNILLAGRDTTACCLSWTFRLLVRHEIVIARLRQEIDCVMSDTVLPTPCVVKELPLNIREATKSTVLPVGGGLDGQSPILVRRGEVVVFSQYITSRQRSIFGNDAGQFRPERWLTDDRARIEPAFFAFSGGPRRCLGEDFALAEIYYTIIRLLKAFPAIVMPEDEPVEPVGAERQRLTLVLASETGCRVKVGSV